MTEIITLVWLKPQSNRQLQQQTYHGADWVWVFWEIHQIIDSQEPTFKVKLSYVSNINNLYDNEIEFKPNSIICVVQCKNNNEEWNT